jgi:hypothetical protein
MNGSRHCQCRDAQLGPASSTSMGAGDTMALWTPVLVTAAGWTTMTELMILLDETAASTVGGTSTIFRKQVDVSRCRQCVLQVRRSVRRGCRPRIANQALRPPPLCANWELVDARCSPMPGSQNLTTGTLPVAPTCPRSGSAKS